MQENTAAPAAETEEQSLSELMQIRRQKLADLKAEGKDPFARTTFDRTAYACLLYTSRCV